jgi:hypothetical protein
MRRNQPNTHRGSVPRRAAALVTIAGLALTGCSSEGSTSSATTYVVAGESTTSQPATTSAAPGTDSGIETGSSQSADTATDATATTATDATTATTATTAPAGGASSSFVAEVWADNWFALYVNGELVGEDSVPITTERSFNAETITFEASYPLTIAIEAKDFKETDSGIEYIGLDNQQMGDGGLIAQITDSGTGEVVGATSAGWSTLVIHRAPLNTECVQDPDPDATCEFESVEAPAGWAAVDFDTVDWSPATEWSAVDVDAKEGYDEISWDDSAALVWGTDLEVDNTILLRTTVEQPA